VKISKLLRSIAHLPETAPLEQKLKGELCGPPPRGGYSRTARAHLLGFWGEYDTYGAYGRKENAGYSAEFAYNHFRCAPDILWLAEVVGIERKKLLAAKAAILGAGPNDASQAAAFRKVIPWSDIEAGMSAKAKKTP